MNQTLDLDNVGKKELTHHFRNMDLLSTVYGKLHRRYRFRAKFLDSMLLLSSLVVIFLILIDPKLLKSFQIKLDQQWFLLRLDAVLIFTLTILAFTIDWKEKAILYRQTKETLAAIKIDCQEVLKLETPEQLKILHTKNIEYNAIINRLPRIPEQVFWRLKTYHKRCQELSRMLESFPGSSISLLRIFIFCRANLHLLLRKPFVEKPVKENG